MLFLPAGYHMQITTGSIISGFLGSESRLVEHKFDISTFCPLTNIYEFSKNLCIQRLDRASLHPAQHGAPSKSLVLDYY